MKALLKILYFFLALILLFLLAGIFLPKSVHVSSSRIVKASPDIVFKQINNLQNWKNWLSWIEADTTMELSYGAKTKGEGATFSWTSKNSGTGTMLIENSEPNTNIDLLLDFGEKGTANMYFELEIQGSGTEISWTFKDDILSYFERYFVFLFTNNMKNSIDRGLQKMEVFTEDLRLSRISDIKLLELEIQPAMAIIDSCTIDDMDSLMANMFSRVKLYLERRKIEASGNPICIFYSWNPEGISRFACALPIEKKTWGWKQYVVIELPAGKAASVTHWGKYESPKPYLALDDYLRVNNLVAGEFIWEQYITSPESTPDTSQWQKQIFFPVE